MKHYTRIQDIDNLKNILEEAKQIKANPLKFKELGKNRTICLLFFNPSLRTRLSTQIAAQNLGMNVIVMNIGEEGWKIETGFGFFDVSNHNIKLWICQNCFNLKLLTRL